MVICKGKQKEALMQINEVIEVLRKSLKDIKFEDIPNKLPTLDFKAVTGFDYSMRVLDIRVISDEVLDIDLRTRDFPIEIDYTITLRKIVSYTPIPKEYITINSDTVMADNVECFVGKLSDIIQSDIIKLDNGDYALETPITVHELDYDKLYVSLGNYGLTGLVDGIMNTVQDAETRLRILHSVKEFYAVWL